jgi:Fur family iron response transcriptional regulator
VDDLIASLRAHGIQPTPQRLEVARFVLGTRAHPSAEEVWRRVRRRCPTLSRATVYNTLNLFVEKGLLRSHVLIEGAVVFDARVDHHHHFIDERSGTIHDVPWDAVEVTGHDRLKGFDVRDFHVVMRGRKRRV